MRLLNFTLLFIISFFLFNEPVVIAADPDGLSRARQAIADRDYVAAEMSLKQWLAGNSDDNDAVFLLAQVFAWQNKFQESLATYDLLLKKHPSNTDYLLGKARTLIWNRNPEAALPLLEKARQLSPDYLEVWRLQIQTLHRLQDETSRQQYNRLLTRASRRFPDTDWPAPLTGLPKNTKVEQKTEIELGTSYNKLSDNLPSWHGYFIGINHAINDSHTLYGTLRTTERFGLDDNELAAGDYYNLNADWFLILDASYSPTYKVLPHWSAYANIGRNFTHGWNTQIGIRHREYERVNTNAGNVTLERYWSDYRGRYVLYMTTIDGDTIDQETEFSHLADLAYYYAGTNHLGISLSKGKELEYNGTDDTLVAKISNVSIFGQHWLQDNKWAVKYLFEYQKQGTFYSRHGFRFSLQHRI